MPTYSQPHRLVVILVAAVAAVVMAVTVTVMAAPTPTMASQKDAVSTVRIVAWGDSVTWGVGNSFNSYRGYLGQRLDGNGFDHDYMGSCPNALEGWKCPLRGSYPDHQHEGHSGWRIDQMARHIDFVLSTFKPNIVLLIAGHNDLAQGQSYTTIAPELIDMVRQIRAKSPGTRVFVGGLPGHAVDSVQAQVRVINQQLAAGVDGLNSSYVHYVPTGIVGIAAGDRYDHVHSNECGYAKIGYLWWYYMRIPLSNNTWPQTRPNPFYDTNGPCASQIAKRR